MKSFLLTLIFILMTIGLCAQGVTKNGQSTASSSSFVNNFGQIGSTAALTKNGQLLSAFYIGMSYQGGKIAYILQPGDPGYNAGITSGIIASLADQSGLPWGWDPVGSWGLPTTLGAGNPNTTRIVTLNNTAGIAARYCSDLVTGGYSDWVLPSSDELTKLYTNRAVLGGFTTGNYWSSSEYDYYYSTWDDENGTQWWDDFYAVYISFANGSFNYSSAGALYNVRPIRYFGYLSILTTTIPVATSGTTATSGGSILSDGGSGVTARGVCWSTTANPTIANSKTTDGSGTGVFSSSITGLTAGVTYYIRAYATNPVGTAYGAQTTITTGLVIISTSALTSTSLTAATGGGVITSDGALSITARGICWSTTTNPTTANSKTVDGSGIGTYSSSPTFTAGVTYYVRAYATNASGSYYGSNVTITSGIGISYQGGKIAYILQPGDPGYNAGVPHGLIATLADQGTAPFGCSDYTQIGCNSGLGTGNANTNLIVASCGVGTAARICYDLSYGGYTDWYLPSYQELLKVYSAQSFIGGFTYGDYYWTSSEAYYYDGMDEWYFANEMYMGSGGINMEGKAIAHVFRAIRSF